MREQLLGLVTGRLALAQELEAPQFVSGDDALAEVVELLLARRPADAGGAADPGRGAGPAGGVDLPVLHAAGWLFFARHLDVPPATRVVNFVAACQLLGPVYLDDSDRVPAQVAAALFATGQSPWEYFSAETGLNTDPEVWFALARAPMTRFLDGQTDVSALRLSVNLLRLAGVAAGDGHPRQIRYVGSLAAQLAILRPLVADLATNMASAEANRAALDALPPDDPGRRLFLGNLGVALFAVGQQTDDVGAVRRAAENFRAVLSMAPDPAERGQTMLNLGGALGYLAARDTDPSVLAEAVALLREVADRSPELANLARRNLGATLVQSADRLDRPSAADDPLRAVCLAAIRPQPPDPPADSIYLNALMYGGIRRFERAGGTLDDLREALRFGRRALVAVEADPASGGYERATVMLNLGTVLQNLAQVSGDVAMMDEAIELTRQAVRRSEAGGYPRGPVLASLAVGLSGRYDLTGDRAAQREALEVSREAVRQAEAEAEAGAGAGAGARVGAGGAEAGEEVPEGDPLSTLTQVRDAHAAVLRNAAVVMDDPGLLREAVDIRRRLAAGPDLPQRARARRLNGLADVLRELAALARDEERVAAAREAVRVAREGMRLTPPDDLNISTYQSNLGRSLRLLSQVTGEDTAVDAVRAARQAVATSDPTSPWWAFHSFQLGQSLYRAANSPAGYEEAMRALHDAVTAPAVRSDIKVNAGRLYASVALRLRRPDVAVQTLAEVVEWLPLVASSDQSRADRERILRNFSDLSNQIVDACVAADRPDRAVELLEQSRGLLYAEALGTRGDLSELSRVDDALAARFAEVRGRIRRLDTAGEPGTGLRGPLADPTGGPAHDPVAERRAAVAEWTALVDQIRRDTPLTDFLRPPRVAELRRLAADGPVIIIQSTSDSGHALIVTADADRPVRHLKLPGLRYEEASERVLTFLAARTVATDQSYSMRARIRGQSEVGRTLAWLWDVAAGPIIEALDLPERADAEGPDTPRVWWCPVGFLTNLPWHAAGHHNPPRPGRAVLDRVVSSYTVSLRALAYARGGRRAHDGGGGLVVIAQPSVPGAHALGGIAEEVRQIERFVPDARVLRDDQASKATVLAELARHAFAHFACHALTDLREPARSRLMLTDHETDPLTVRDLSALHLEGRELAVLSACSTYETNPATADDAVHLTAAFQLAGYRHVVGSLWPVSDATAADVARDIYGHLTGGGQHPPDAAGTALALHRCVRQLRERFSNAPSVWAAYLHTGA